MYLSWLDKGMASLQQTRQRELQQRTFPFHYLRFGTDLIFLPTQGFGIKLFLKGSYGIDMHVYFSRLKEVLTLDLENIP
jgi:hypothetical protein|uniref:Uncharacterized protein n=1 Tax=Picea glauca TaxID=3330 RepID=A0A101M3S9_PICGL|nr:hypothetical protein ABT39_MTgene272 [Picea glauca]